MDVGENIHNHILKLFLQDQSLLIDLRARMIVDLTIVPTQLNIVEGLLDDLISAFVVLPSDLVEIDWLLHDVLVVA